MEKSNKNDTSRVVVTRSTSLLVMKPGAEEEEYDPYQHRSPRHPTTDFETLVHMVKGCVGSGVLAMPLAFYNAGLVCGIIAFCFVGFLAAYCMHMLVCCAQILCKRTKVPILTFSEIGKVAFQTGPQNFHKFSGIVAGCIDTFLVLELLGGCCVYNVFVAKNIKQVVDFYVDNEWPLQYYLLMFTPALIISNWIRNLKFLAPLSLLANILYLLGLGITFYYIFRDLPSITNSGLPSFSSWEQLPLFFGTAIFSLEGIGVVMPLENDMKKPNHFIGCPAVLHIGMAIVVALFASLGFFGYLTYGSNTESNITLNLPTEEVLAQSVKLMIAVAIFFTYALQFFVAFEIIWKLIRHYFGSYKTVAEYASRAILVLCTVGVSAVVPNISPFISLVGAVCLSTIGITLPATIDVATYWESPGLGCCYWRLWKDLLIIMCGLLAFATGTWSSVTEIVEQL